MQTAGIHFPFRQGDYVFAPSAVHHKCGSVTNLDGVITSSHSEGYSSLFAFRRVQPIGKFSLGSGNPENTLSFKFDGAALPTEDEKRALAKSLHGIMERYGADSIRVRSSFSPSSEKVWIVFSNGMTTEGSVNRGERDELTLQVRLSRVQAAGAGELVEKLNRGEIFLKIYSEPDTDFMSIRTLVTTQVALIGSTLTTTIGVGSSVQLVQELWDGATSTKKARTAVLEEALKLLDTFPSADAKTQLDAIFKLADLEWTTSPELTPDVAWSVNTLKFLNRLDPHHPTHRIYEAFSRISASYQGLRSDVEAGAALEKSIWLVERSGLTESQKNSVIATLSAIRSMKLPYADAWKKAIELTVQAGYNDNALLRLLTRVQHVYEWMKSYSGAYLDDAQAIDKADLYVLEKNLAAERVELLIGAFEWTQSYSGPFINDKSAALKTAENYVFTRNLTDASLAKLKSRFDAAYPVSRDKSTALAQAEADVFGN